MITRSGFLLAFFALSLVHSHSFRIIGRSPLYSQVEQRSDTDDNRQGFIWNIYRRFAGITDTPPLSNNNKDTHPEQNVDQIVDEKDSDNSDSDIDKDYDHGNKSDQEIEEIHSTMTTTIAPAHISYQSPYYPYNLQPALHTQSVFNIPPYYPSSSFPNPFTQSMYKPIYGDIYSNPPPLLPLPPLINITYSPVLTAATNSSAETSSVTDPIITSKDVRAQLADLVLKSLTQNFDFQDAFNPLQSYQKSFLRSSTFNQNASPLKLFKTINSGPFVITSNVGYDVSNYQQQEDERQHYVTIPVALIENSFENDEYADDSQQKYYVPSRNSYRLINKHQSNVQTSRPLKARKQNTKYTRGVKKRKRLPQRRRKQAKKLNTSSGDDELPSNGKQFINDINKQ